MSVSRVDRNRVELVGEITGPVRVRDFESGSVLLSFSLRVRTAGPDGQATASVPVAWWDPGTDGADMPGRRARVSGRVIRRFFSTPGGLRSVTEVVANEVEMN